MHYLVQQCLGGSRTSKTAEFSVLRKVPGVTASAVTEVNINTAFVIVHEDRQITLRNLWVCPGESVQFSKNKTKNFDHYMDYY